ncbi:MAG: hypothetical protein M4579_005992 [Chaenotheca gracillima]|nr:MAG: hypothetical protein M4579_005992 [Chaenotheca gracillima]
MENRISFFYDRGVRYEKSSEIDYGFYAVQYPPYVEDDLDGINGRLPPGEYMQPPAGFQFPLDLPNFENIDDPGPEHAVQELDCDLNNNWSRNLKLIQGLRDKEMGYPREPTFDQADLLRVCADPPVSTEIVFLLERKMNRKMKHDLDIKRGEGYINSDELRTSLRRIRAERLAEAGLKTELSSFLHAADQDSTASNVGHTGIDELTLGVDRIDHKKGSPKPGFFSVKELIETEGSMPSNALEFLNQRAHIRARLEKSTPSTNWRIMNRVDQISAFTENEKVSEYLRICGSGITTSFRSPEPLWSPCSDESDLSEDYVERAWIDHLALQGVENTRLQGTEMSCFPSWPESSSSSIHSSSIMTSSSKSELQDKHKQTQEPSTRKVHFDDNPLVRLRTRSPSLDSSILEAINAIDSISTDSLSDDSWERPLLPPFAFSTLDLTSAVSAVEAGLPLSSASERAVPLHKHHSSARNASKSPSRQERDPGQSRSSGSRSRPASRSKGRKTAGNSTTIESISASAAGSAPNPSHISRSLSKPKGRQVLRKRSNGPSHRSSAQHTSIISQKPSFKERLRGLVG